jgi:protein gp37
MSENYWKQPLRWNKAAEQAGERARVFCASMADVFEDHPQLPPLRDRLWNLIEQTPMLDWLLLTKRPENMTSMAPASWAKGWPDNAWAMTSVENQEYADRRIPELLKVPARVRGLSCEPLLGPVDLSRWVFNRRKALNKMIYGPAALNEEQADAYIAPVGIHWVIVGGESGHGARPMHPDWARSLVRQCREAGVAPFVKQLGSVWAKDWTYAGRSVAAWGDTKGGDMQYWPQDLRVREFPQIEEHANA